MNGINTLAHNGLLNSIPETHGRVQNVLEQLQLFENVEPYDMDLAKLVSLARSDEATNIRDKIYALLSLATDTTDLHMVVNKQHVPFEIDYTKSVKEIYTDAAQAMIRSSGLQDILTQARRRKDSIHDLATWVPDWSVTRVEFGIDKHAWRPNSMKIGYHGNDITHAGGKYLKNFKASRRNACPDFHEDGTLHVQGIHFDDLKGLNGTYPGSSFGGADLITWLEECDQLAAQCLPDRTSGSKTEALWRTLIADQMGNIRPAPPTTEEEFWNFRLFLKRLQLPYDENLDEDLVYSVKDATPFTAEIGSRCKSRQFAITHGKYMCLVPDTAKIGDTVAIIDGCSIPTILRPDQGQFRLIGDCYVHGIMYGENERPATRSSRRKSCIRNEIRKFIIK